MDFFFCGGSPREVLPLPSFLPPLVFCGNPERTCESERAERDRKREREREREIERELNSSEWERIEKGREIKTKTRQREGSRGVEEYKRRVIEKKHWVLGLSPLPEFLPKV